MFARQMNISKVHWLRSYHIWYHMKNSGKLNISPTFPDVWKICTHDYINDLIALDLGDHKNVLLGECSESPTPILPVTRETRKHKSTRWGGKERAVSKKVRLWWSGSRGQEKSTSISFSLVPSTGSYFPFAFLGQMNRAISLSQIQQILVNKDQKQSLMWPSDQPTFPLFYTHFARLIREWHCRTPASWSSLIFWNYLLQKSWGIYWVASLPLLPISLLTPLLQPEQVFLALWRDSQKHWPIFSLLPPQPRNPKPHMGTWLPEFSHRESLSSPSSLQSDLTPTCSDHAMCVCRIFVSLHFTEANGTRKNQRNSSSQWWEWRLKSHTNRGEHFLALLHTSVLFLL